MIRGARHLEVEKLASRTPELSKDREIGPPGAPSLARPVCPQPTECGTRSDGAPSIARPAGVQTNLVAKTRKMGKNYPKPIETYLKGKVSKNVSGPLFIFS